MLEQSAFSATGLIDSAILEQEQAERRDDISWDPEGLYALEVERDEAMSELLRNLGGVVRVDPRNENRFPFVEALLA